MTRGRPRKINPDDALHLAMLSFWEKGYDATSMSDIVTSTGMAKPGLYATFGDKEALYKKAMLRYVDFRGKPLMQILHQSRKKARGALNDFYMAMIDAMTAPDTPDGCFLTNTLVKSENEEPAIKQLAKEIKAVRTERMLEFLTNAQASGKLSKKNNPVQLANFLSAQMLTIAILQKSGENKNALKEYAKSMLQIIREE